MKKFAIKTNVQENYAAHNGFKGAYAWKAKTGSNFIIYAEDETEAQEVKKFIEEKDPILVVAELLLGNDLVNLSKQLNKLSYSANENKAISFLVAFSKLDDINNIYKMKKLFDKSGVTPEQLRTFNSINSVLPSNVVDKFINFKLSVTGKDVQDELGIKPGPEMGQAIEKMEINNFNKLL